MELPCHSCHDDGSNELEHCCALKAIAEVNSSGKGGRSTEVTDARVEARRKRPLNRVAK